MDSITQITLGAAAGEVIAGKRIGNRALIWGAIAGTIPDLDILANPFVSEIDALAFHRGLSHSFFFSIVGSFAFGWLVYRMYKSNYHRLAGAIGWGLIAFFILILVNQPLFAGQFELDRTLISVFLLLLAAIGIYTRYVSAGPGKPNADLKLWRWLFFWSLVTHPILDTFTTYGTQLFQPFSNYRAAFNSISVADPAYTVPFLLCVIICSFFRRNHIWRQRIVWIGISLSSIYLLATVANKFRINSVMKESLISENIDFSRFMTSPTILNNVLWYGCAETDSSYYIGLYSLYDRERKFKLEKIAKGHNIIGTNEEDRTLKKLKWFSNNYYSVESLEGDEIQINDMRYGTFQRGQDGKREYIFNFTLSKDEQGSYYMESTSAGPPDRERREMFRELLVRIKGI